ncbi:unnamed protein product [Protopolystoma xenopodis]|uniref:Uncharacterized protein n=1 Tax=Protopolystoma xenopodis TaxID=117903 RepID=A0A448WKS8_9PLAT|nr:unnamed protein product [Protopolystoma xenopodis]
MGSCSSRAPHAGRGTEEFRLKLLGRLLIINSASLEAVRLLKSFYVPPSNPSPASIVAGSYRLPLGIPD